MDMKTHCSKKKCVCKHICFILLRVCKIYDYGYYHNLILSSNNFKILIDKLKILQPDSDIISQDLIKKLNSLTLNFTLQKSICDDCCICFEEINEDTSKDTIVECPTCHNVVHNKCIDKWLSKSYYKNCPYCRSDVWKSYGTKGVLKL